MKEIRKTARELMAGFGDPHLVTVDAAGLRLGVVGSRWHADLVDHMIERAALAAKECGVTDVVVERVAGSMELPVVAQALARRSDTSWVQLLSGGTEITCITRTRAQTAEGDLLREIWASTHVRLPADVSLA